jgi:hypothetical protein
MVKEFSTDSFRCVFEQVRFIWFVSHTTGNEKRIKLYSVLMYSCVIDGPNKTNLVKEEVRIVIRFLWAKYINLIEMHCQLIEVYRMTFAQFKNFFVSK